MKIMQLPSVSHLSLDVGFWAGKCICVLLLFLYGLYCDTALGNEH